MVSIAMHVVVTHFGIGEAVFWSEKIPGSGAFRYEARLLLVGRGILPPCRAVVGAHAATRANQTGWFTVLSYVQMRRGSVQNGVLRSELWNAHFRLILLVMTQQKPIRTLT